MHDAPENIRLMKRAYWLVRLRWLAVVGVIATTYFARNIVGISLQETAIYVIAVVLALYNAMMLGLLNHFREKSDGTLRRSVGKIINVQMSLDLFLLIVLLHLSGGAENPFVFYFVFHMIIASILLSVRESYLHATFSVLLFGALILFEYKGIIPHHCLRGFVSYDMHQEGTYLIGSFSALATTLYLVVYMTSSIAVQLKEQERAYWEANVELKRKDRLKDEYVARVTHDIKGHLAAIHSCLEVVANKLVGSLNPKQSEFINRAHNRTKMLTTFVRMLLRLTQMRLSDRFEEEVFSFEEAARNVITSVRGRAEAKSLDLRCNIQLSAGEILGNRFSVEEAMMNLMLNAVKYTPEKGTVEVNVKAEGDVVVTKISDTGIGIPENEQGNIFEEFYRGSNARKIERDGTGLGLSIVKQIIDRHGGEIWFESRQGSGTIFTFTLPKVVAKTEQSV